MASEGGGSRQIKDCHWEPEKEGRLNPFISTSLLTLSYFSLIFLFVLFLLPSPVPSLPFSSFPFSLLPLSSLLLQFILLLFPSLSLSFILFPPLYSFFILCSSSFLLCSLLRLSSCLILNCAVQTEPVVTCVYVLNPNAASRSHARFLSAFDQESL